MKRQEKYGEAQLIPREVALAYLDSFSSGDPAAVAAHVSEDFQNNQMGVLGMTFSGRDLYRERLAGYLSAFQDITYTAEEVIVENNKVVIAYHMAAINGKQPISIKGVMIISTSKDGLVKARSDYWDGLSYLKQAGIGL
ncbi:MAG: ester cyclase [Alphaproteobacteria bacterium]|nr:ester cyclase [Alphaproteobacteria bacterium]